MAADIEALLGIGAGKQDLSAMAEALRRQQRGGQILALSPDKQISAMGTGMIDRAGSGATKMGGLNKSALQAEALRTQQDRQAGATKGYRDQQQQNWQANFDADAAQRKGEANKRVQYWDIATGKPMGTASQMEGSGLLVNTNDGTPYDPKKYTLKDPRVGRAAGRGRSPDSFAPPTAKQVKELEDTGLQSKKIDELVAAWQPEFASESAPIGGIENWLAREVPGVATQGMKDQQQWWSRYKNDRELAARNKLFGSALTATEQAEWRKATINPSMQEDQIVRQLELLQKVQQYIAAKAGENAVLKGWNEPWIKSNLGPWMGEQAAAPTGDTGADLSAVPAGEDPDEWAATSDEDKQYFLDYMQ